MRYCKMRLSLHSATDLHSEGAAAPDAPAEPVHEVFCEHA
jgi:hypothetical protein